jgi:D-alanyl-D-alanine carboxypeptidase/D-alanyl-D-alanine-endopeptidase (penicillin-binding protein 4)
MPVRSWLFAALVGLTTLGSSAAFADIAPPSRLDALEADARALAGSDGVVYVVDEGGRPLLELGGDRAFIPASTLKLVTALLAAEYLGMDSRFQTRFFLQDGALVVQGQGDPFLVSEELDLIAAELKPLLPTDGIAGVLIDDSFFASGIQIPGVGASENPYDALNSATAVNFNTINVTRSGADYVSAEDQTPMTPLAREVAQRRGVKSSERINLSSDPAEVRRYASELIAAKLRGMGVHVGDGTGDAVAMGEPLHVHASSKTVSESVGALLYYSNNYIANQVFLAIGAKVHGAPATLDKSVRVADAWLAAHPEFAGITMTEGSGISYDNRVTGPALAAVLTSFAPHKGLLRQKHDTPNKTGTLKVTKTVAGYLDTKHHGTVRFVISLDGAGSGRRWQLVDVLREHL